MRHGKRRSKINRKSTHRKATFSMMAKHLFIHQEVKTTLGKAKEARRLAERLITIAKKDDLASRRRAFSILRDRDTVVRLFKEIRPLFSKRIGGYTRIIPIRHRRGDGARIVLLELTERIKEEEPIKKIKAQKLKATEPKPTKPEKEVKRVVPEVSPEVKKEKTVEEVKKDKAKKEEKRVEKKSFFKKFFRRRTKM